MMTQKDIEALLDTIKRKRTATLDLTLSDLNRLLKDRELTQKILFLERHQDHDRRNWSLMMYNELYSVPINEITRVIYWRTVNPSRKNTRVEDEMTLVINDKPYGSLAARDVQALIDGINAILARRQKKTATA